MSSSVLEAASALREALLASDPRVLSGKDCALAADALATTEKACATWRLLAAARAVETGAHRERGFRDGADWLARQSGSTPSQARKALDTANHLDDRPDTKQALLSGEISLEQAREITATPSAESDLLATARQGDLSQVRERARDHRLTNTDPAELRRRQFQMREFRHWLDREGMVRFTGALPPETGLPFVRRIDGAAARMRRAARASGDMVERFEAYLADAAVQLVNAAGTADDIPPSARVDLVVVCDISAWRRGHAHLGEPCHIIGGGPIPVDVAKELSKDAFLKAVLHDGVEIRTVKHFGRHIPAPLRTALDLGPVPAFTGRECVDCGRKWGLQDDHDNPVANGGMTERSNLKDRCWPCHQEKTERDRRAGLLGPHPSVRRKRSQANAPPGTS